MKHLRPPRLSRRTGSALVTALVTWAALALQLGIKIASQASDGASALVAIWQYFGFFTILTNTAVALVATAMLVTPQSALAGRRSRLTAAAAIALVGLIYSLALRAHWNPEGWQKVADHLLHDVSPILFLIAFVLWSDGKLAWRDALVTTLAPLAYFGYAMARGAFDGWYAYYFLDPTALGIGQLLVNVALLLIAFLVFALLLIALDRWLGNRRSET